MDIIERLRTSAVDEETALSLEDKCQENRWLRRGGCAWQDDPYLEDYPYEFARLDDIEDLRAFFAHGNWALRQGIVCGDLAFVNQDDGGDEWWTLRRTQDGWLAFESWALEGMAKDPVAFSRLITSMQMATLEQCRRIRYMLPESESRLEWGFSSSEALAWNGQMVRCRSFCALTDGYEASLYERPSFPGYVLDVVDCKAGSILVHREGIEDVLAAALEAEHTIASPAHDGIETRDELSRVPLSIRCASARDLSRALSASGDDRCSDARERAMSAIDQDKETRR